MNYWIDGHNLIGKTPDISLADEDDEAQLVRRLKQWAGRDRRRQVTLFFDAGLPGGEERRWTGGRVTVIFASVGRSADSLLIYRMRQVERKAGPEYTVITSDQAIIKVARQQKMNHLYAEVFAAMMAQEANPTPLPTVTDDPVVSAREVAEWLDLFGPEPETPPPAPVPTRPGRSPEPPQAAKPQKVDLRPRKTDRVHLSPDEVEAWLALFAAAPATVEENPTKPAPPSAHPVTPAKTESPLPTRKKTTSKLSPDEVNAWMDLFRRGRDQTS